LPRLRAPLRVDHGANRWSLGPQEAKVTFDMQSTLDQALAESRNGNMFTRSLRSLTGQDLDLELTPEIGYSDAAIVRLIDRVRAKVDRPAVDAKVQLGLNGPELVPAKSGLKVDASLLHKRMRAAITSATAPRRISAKTAKEQPKVSTSQARAGYDTALVVNRGAFTLSLFKDFKKVKTYPIAVGAIGLETPAGTYSIANKAVDPAWTKPHSDWVPEDERGEVVPGGTPENPLKARWMGIFDGAGIHGIDPSLYGTIGSAASHGCVRMRIPDVVALYDEVPVGAPIYIG
jgi:lipoprotein-anchoring transpeptidase ErfK/SrfK